MKLRTTLMAATIIAAPAFMMTAAQAQPVTGPYVSLGLGYNIMGSRDLKSLTSGGMTTSLGGSKALFHHGFTGDVAVGYGLGNGFRVELEGDYLSNQVAKVDNGPAQQLAIGKEDKYGAMVNALYDFDIGVPYVYPYLGAGVGYQFMNWKGVNALGDSVNNTEGSFAYQGIVGFSFPVTPGLSGTLEYRYLATTGNNKYKGSYGGMPSSLSVGHDTNNMIMVGLRYELFPPAPPAPPVAPTPVAAPAPAPARTYLVFFNWNKANLTTRAQHIVSEAAKASQNTDVTRLNVNGYTDTSGAAKYNMKLSLRRAHNVAAQLMADGVAKDEIEIKGFGETHLLVPTGPNVREPQNRRVEIILH